MKRVGKIITVLIAIFILKAKVIAASGNITVSTENVYVGNSFTVSANISSAAAWNVHVTATGPVSGCTINEADATSDAQDTNKTFTATCTATAEGTITITLSGDVTSASNDNAVTLSGTKNVVARVPSNNNKLSELRVEGHEITKVDNNNYTLTVSYDVTSINVIATLEDARGRLTGTGIKNINIGENNIEVVATSESGIANKINIKVTRKDDYYIEDLEKVLNNSNIKEKNIKILENTKITASDMEKIKTSKKEVKFNYYDNQKKLIYSWIIDGTKIKESKEITTKIIKETENAEKIKKLSNYAEGIYVNLGKVSEITEGVKLKIYVGEKYKDNEEVNIYGYEEETISLLKEKVKVEAGYIEFELSKYKDYYIVPTMKEEMHVKVPSTGKKGKIIIVIIFGAAITIGTIYIIKRRKNNKEIKEEEKQKIL